MGPACQHVAAGCIQPLIDDSIVGRRDKSASLCLVRLIGKQTALYHERVAVGKIPVGPESRVHPPPMVGGRRSIGHRRVSYLEVFAEYAEGSILPNCVAVLRQAEAV